MYMEFKTRSSSIAEIARGADDAIQGHSRSSFFCQSTRHIWLPISTQ